MGWALKGHFIPFLCCFFIIFYALKFQYAELLVSACISMGIQTGEAFQTFFDLILGTQFLLLAINVSVFLFATLVSSSVDLGFENSVISFFHLTFYLVQLDRNNGTSGIVF